MSEVHESQLFVEENRNITDKHQTSPLTEITTSPPQVPSDFSLDLETSKIDTDKLSSQITDKLEYQSFRRQSKTNTTRNNSVDSYISSDLSEIDSEAETDKMEFLEYQKSDLETLSHGKLPHDHIDDSNDTSNNNDNDQEDEHENINDYQTSSNGKGHNNNNNNNEEESSNDTLTMDNKEELPSESKAEILNTSSNKDLNSSLSGTKNLVKSFMNGSLNSHIEVEEENESSDVSSSNESKKRLVNNIKEENNLKKKRRFEESEIESTIEEHEHENETEQDARNNGIDESEVNQHRNEAISALTEIEIEFAELRDKLYQDKLKQLEYELNLCVEGAHPELQKIYMKINNHFTKKKTLAENNLNYKLQCIDNQTKSERVQLHQQFLKNVSDTRYNMLNLTTAKWYKINKERSLLDEISAPDAYKISTCSKNELIIQRNNIHKEISLLTGLTKYYGFPSAPGTTSANNEEIDDDLMKMGII